MKPIRDTMISIISNLPDEALWILYVLDRGSAKVWRRIQPVRTIEGSSGVYRNQQPVNFLCFIGVNWFTQFMLKKMREYGFHYYARQIDAFKGWKRNYREFSKIELPVDCTTEPDFILVDHIFFRNHRLALGYEAMYAFIKRVSRNFSIPVIGIDSSDTILCKFHPKSTDCFDLILKGQGLPKDRELMNWEIGVRWGLNRNTRIRRVRFEDMLLSQDQIDKFVVSFDLGSATYCDVQVSPPPSVPESYDVFFFAVFNSLNRLEGLKISRKHFETLGWLQMIPNHPVVGIEAWKADPQEGRLENRAELVRQVNRLYGQHRELFRRARLAPCLYKMLAQSCKVMPAFSGIGELGMRHYQAFEFRKAMICEDVSYIETIFPFEDGKNCVFVAERLEDFEEKVRWLLENEDIRRNVASAGFNQLQETYKDGNAVFEEFFLEYLGIQPRRKESILT